MKSFERDYLLQQPISQNLLMVVRGLGEFRGREKLYEEQFPEFLETLRQVPKGRDAHWKRTGSGSH